MTNATKKLIGMVTILCFVTTQCLSAAPGMEIGISSQRETPSSLQIDIPAELATLDGIFEAPAGPDPRMILHIQNAHANYGAQEKIKQLLQYLEKNYAIKTIFVEGASEDLNPDYLKMFPDRERNLKLADYLAKQGELTGAEMYLLEQDGGRRMAEDARAETPSTIHHPSSAVRAHGIERAELYRENYEALKKVFASETTVNRYLGGFESRLDGLASKVFSPDLRKLLGEWRQFEKGRREFMPYIKKLSIAAKRILSLDLESLFSQVEWPQITRLLVLQTMEKELDMPKGLAERDVVIKFLQEKGVSGKLIQGVRNFQDQRVSMVQGSSGGGAAPAQPRDLMEQLVAEAGPKGFRFSNYPNFSLYAGYLILKNELDPKSLFEEIKTLFVQILDKLAENERQKNLLRLYRDEELVRKLLNLELTRKDWQEVLEKKEALDMDSMVSRLREIGTAVSRETGLPLTHFETKKVNPKFRADVLEVQTAAYRFYEAARKREEVFYERIDTVLTKAGERKAVLITGGFHTDGITELLREHEVSYGILTPRLSEKSDEHLYRSVMLMNKPSPFELSYLEAMSRLISWAAQTAQVGMDQLAQSLAPILKGIGYAGDFGNIREAIEIFNGSPLAVRAEIRINPDPVGQRGGKPVYKIIVSAKSTIPAATTEGYLAGLNDQGAGVTPAPAGLTKNPLIHAAASQAVAVGRTMSRTEVGSAQGTPDMGPVVGNLAAQTGATPAEVAAAMRAEIRRVSDAASRHMEGGQVVREGTSQSAGDLEEGRSRFERREQETQPPRAETRADPGGLPGQSPLRGASNFLGWLGGAFRQAPARVARQNQDPTVSDIADRIVNQLRQGSEVFGYADYGMRLQRVQEAPHSADGVKSKKIIELVNQKLREAGEVELMRRLAEYQSVEDLLEKAVARDRAKDPAESFDQRRENLKIAESVIRRQLFAKGIRVASIQYVMGESFVRGRLLHMLFVERGIAESMTPTFLSDDFYQAPDQPDFFPYSRGYFIIYDQKKDLKSLQNHKAYLVPDERERRILEEVINGLVFQRLETKENADAMKRKILIYQDLFDERGDVDQALRARSEFREIPSVVTGPQATFVEGPVSYGEKRIPFLISGSGYEVRFSNLTQDLLQSNTATFVFADSAKNGWPLKEVTGTISAFLPGETEPRKSFPVTVRDGRVDLTKILRQYPQAIGFYLVVAKAGADHYGASGGHIELTSLEPRGTEMTPETVPSAATVAENKNVISSEELQILIAEIRSADSVAVQHEDGAGYSNMLLQKADHQTSNSLFISTDSKNHPFISVNFIGGRYTPKLISGEAAERILNVLAEKEGSGRWLAALDDMRNQRAQSVLNATRPGRTLHDRVRRILWKLSHSWKPPQDIMIPGYRLKSFLDQITKSDSLNLIRQNETLFYLDIFNDKGWVVGSFPIFINRKTGKINIEGGFTGGEPVSFNNAMQVEMLLQTLKKKVTDPGTLAMLDQLLSVLQPTPVATSTAPSSENQVQSVPSGSRPLLSRGLMSFLGISAGWVVLGSLLSSGVLAAEGNPQPFTSKTPEASETISNQIFNNALTTIEDPQASAQQKRTALSGLVDLVKDELNKGRETFPVAVVHYLAQISRTAGEDIELQEASLRSLARMALFPTVRETLLANYMNDLGEGSKSDSGDAYIAVLRALVSSRDNIGDAALGVITARLQDSSSVTREAALAALEFRLNKPGVLEPFLEAFSQIPQGGDEQDLALMRSQILDVLGRFVGNMSALRKLNPNDVRTLKAIYQWTRDRLSQNDLSEKNVNKLVGLRGTLEADFASVLFSRTSAPEPSQPAPVSSALPKMSEPPPVTLVTTPTPNISEPLTVPAVEQAPEETISMPLWKSISIALLSLTGWVSAAFFALGAWSKGEETRGVMPTLEPSGVPAAKQEKEPANFLIAALQHFANYSSTSIYLRALTLPLFGVFVGLLYMVFHEMGHKIIHYITYASASPLGHVNLFSSPPNYHPDRLGELTALGRFLGSTGSEILRTYGGDLYAMAAFVASLTYVTIKSSDKFLNFSRNMALITVITSLSPFIYCGYSAIVMLTGTALWDSWDYTQGYLTSGQFAILHPLVLTPFLLIPPIAIAWLFNKYLPLSRIMYGEASEKPVAEATPLPIGRVPVVRSEVRLGAVAEPARPVEFLPKISGTTPATLMHAGTELGSVFSPKGLSLYANTHEIIERLESLRGAISGSLSTTDPMRASKAYQLMDRVFYALLGRGTDASGLEEDLTVGFRLDAYLKELLNVWNQEYGDQEQSGIFGLYEQMLRINFLRNAAIGKILNLDARLRTMQTWAKGRENMEGVTQRIGRLRYLLSTREGLLYMMKVGDGNAMERALEPIAFRIDPANKSLSLERRLSDFSQLFSDFEQKFGFQNALRDETTPSLDTLEVSPLESEGEAVAATSEPTQEYVPAPFNQEERTPSSPESRKLNRMLLGLKNVLLAMLVPVSVVSSLIMSVLGFVFSFALKRFILMMPSVSSFVRLSLFETPSFLPVPRVRLQFINGRLGEPMPKTEVCYFTRQTEQYDDFSDRVVRRDDSQLQAFAPAGLDNTDLDRIDVEFPDFIFLGNSPVRIPILRTKKGDFLIPQPGKNAASGQMQCELFYDRYGNVYARPLPGAPRTGLLVTYYRVPAGAIKEPGAAQTYIAQHNGYFSAGDSVWQSQKPVPFQDGKIDEIINTLDLSNPRLSNQEKVARLQTYLREVYPYSAGMADTIKARSHGQHTLPENLSHADSLFCATAALLGHVILRRVGIPSRMEGGYLIKASRSQHGDVPLDFERQRTVGTYDNMWDYLSQSGGPHAYVQYFDGTVWRVADFTSDTVLSQRRWMKSYGLPLPQQAAELKGKIARATHSIRELTINDNPNHLSSPGTFLFDVMPDWYWGGHFRERKEIEKLSHLYHILSGYFGNEKYLAEAVEKVKASFVYRDGLLDGRAVESPWTVIHEGFTARLGGENGGDLAAPIAAKMNEMTPSDLFQIRIEDIPGDRLRRKRLTDTEDMTRRLLHYYIVPTGDYIFPRIFWDDKEQKFYASFINRSWQRTNLPFDTAEELQELILANIDQVSREMAQQDFSVLKDRLRIATTLLAEETYPSDEVIQWLIWGQSGTPLAEVSIHPGFQVNVAASLLNLRRGGIGMENGTSQAAEAVWHDRAGKPRYKLTVDQAPAASAEKEFYDWLMQFAPRGDAERQLFARSIGEFMNELNGSLYGYELLPKVGSYFYKAIYRQRSVHSWENFISRTTSYYSQHQREFSRPAGKPAITLSQLRRKAREYLVARVPSEKPAGPMINLDRRLAQEIEEYLSDLKVMDSKGRDAIRNCILDYVFWDGKDKEDLLRIKERMNQISSEAGIRFFKQEMFSHFGTRPEADLNFFIWYRLFNLALRGQTGKDAQALGFAGESSFEEGFTKDSVLKMCLQEESGISQGRSEVRGIAKDSLSALPREQLQEGLFEALNKIPMNLSGSPQEHIYISNVFSKNGVDTITLSVSTVLDSDLEAAALDRNLNTGFGTQWRETVAEVEIKMRGRAIESVKADVPGYLNKFPKLKELLEEVVMSWLHGTLKVEKTLPEANAEGLNLVAPSSGAVSAMSAPTANAVAGPDVGELEQPGLPGFDEFLKPQVRAEVRTDNLFDGKLWRLMELADEVGMHEISSKNIRTVGDVRVSKIQPEVKRLLADISAQPEQSMTITPVSFNAIRTGDVFRQRVQRGRESVWVYFLALGYRSDNPEELYMIDSDGNVAVIPQPEAGREAMIEKITRRSETRGEIVRSKYERPSSPVRKLIFRVTLCGTLLTAGLLTYDAVALAWLSAPEQSELTVDTKKKNIRVGLYWGNPELQQKIRSGDKAFYVANGNVYRETKKGDRVVSGLFRVDGVDISPFNPNTGGNAQAKGVFIVQPNGRVVIIPTDQFDPARYPARFFRYAMQSGPMAVYQGKINEALFAWYRAHGERLMIVGVDGKGNLQVKEFWGKDPFGQTPMGMKAFEKALRAWVKKKDVQAALCVDSGSKGLPHRVGVGGLSVPVNRAEDPGVIIYAEPRVPSVSPRSEVRIPSAVRAAIAATLVTAAVNLKGADVTPITSGKNAPAAAQVTGQKTEISIQGQNFNVEDLLRSLNREGILGEVTPEKLDQAARFSGAQSSIVRQAYELMVQKGMFPKGTFVPVIFLKDIPEDLLAKMNTGRDNFAVALNDVGVIVVSAEPFQGVSGGEQAKVLWVVVKVAHEATHIQDFRQNPGMSILLSEAHAFRSTAIAAKLEGASKEQVEAQENVAKAFEILADNSEAIVKIFKTNPRNFRFVNYNGIVAITADQVIVKLTLNGKEKVVGVDLKAKPASQINELQLKTEMPGAPVMDKGTIEQKIKDAEPVLPKNSKLTSGRDGVLTVHFGVDGEKAAGAADVTGLVNFVATSDAVFVAHQNSRNGNVVYARIPLSGEDAQFQTRRVPSRWHISGPDLQRDYPPIAEQLGVKRSEFRGSQTVLDILSKARPYHEIFLSMGPAANQLGFDRSALIQVQTAIQIYRLEVLKALGILNPDSTRIFSLLEGTDWLPRFFAREMVHTESLGGKGQYPSVWAQENDLLDENKGGAFAKEFPGFKPITPSVETQTSQNILTREWTTAWLKKMEAGDVIWLNSVSDLWEKERLPKNQVLEWFKFLLSQLPENVYVLVNEKDPKKLKEFYPENQSEIQNVLETRIPHDYETLQNYGQSVDSSWLILAKQMPSKALTPTVFEVQRPAQEAEIQKSFLLRTIDVIFGIISFIREKILRWIWERQVKFSKPSLKLTISHPREVAPVFDEGETKFVLHEGGNLLMPFSSHRDFVRRDLSEGSDIRVLWEKINQASWDWNTLRTNWEMAQTRTNYDAVVKTLRNLYEQLSVFDWKQQLVDAAQFDKGRSAGQAEESAVMLVRQMRMFLLFVMSQLDLPPQPPEQIRLNELLLLVKRMRGDFGFLLEVDNSTQLDLVADEIGLYQVLVNLIKNAYEAIQTDPRYQGDGRKNARIRIEAKVLSGGKVQLFVKDNGPGMPEKNMYNFRNGVRGSTKQGPGRGVGLLITKEIIQQRLHGQVEIEAAPKMGTTFTLTLPLDARSVVSSSTPDDRDMKRSELRAGSKMPVALENAGAPVSVSRRIYDLGPITGKTFDRLIHEVGNFMGTMFPLTDMDPDLLVGTELGRFRAGLDRAYVEWKNAQEILLRDGLTEAARESIKKVLSDFYWLFNQAPWDRLRAELDSFSVSPSSFFDLKDLKSSLRMQEYFYWFIASSLIDTEKIPPTKIYVKSMLEAIARNSTVLRNKVVVDETPLPGSRDAAVVLVADGAALVQVLMNLVRNAQRAVEMKFGESSQEGKIHIQIKQINDGKIQIEVADNGVGMSPHVLAKALKVSVTTKEQQEGHGIGLMVVSDLVKNRLGGEIAVVSQEGKGTTFTLTLPADITKSSPSVRAEMRDIIDLLQSLTGEWMKIIAALDDAIVAQNIDEAHSLQAKKVRIEAAQARIRAMPRTQKNFKRAKAIYDEALKPVVPATGETETPQVARKAPKRSEVREKSQQSTSVFQIGEHVYRIRLIPEGNGMRVMLVDEKGVANPSRYPVIRGRDAEIRIGRSQSEPLREGEDVILITGDIRVSRNHAIIFYDSENELWFLQDQNSKNGVLKDKKKLEAGARMPIEWEDVQSPILQGPAKNELDGKPYILEENGKGFEIPGGMKVIVVRQEDGLHVRIVKTGQDVPETGVDGTKFDLLLTPDVFISFGTGVSDNFQFPWWISHSNFHGSIWVNDKGAVYAQMISENAAPSDSVRSEVRKAPSTKKGIDWENNLPKDVFAAGKTMSLGIVDLPGLKRAELRGVSEATLVAMISGKIFDLKMGLLRAITVISEIVKLGGAETGTLVDIKNRFPQLAASVGDLPGFALDVLEETPTKEKWDTIEAVLSVDPNQYYGLILLGKPDAIFWARFRAMPVGVQKRLQIKNIDASRLDAALVSRQVRDGAEKMWKRVQGGAAFRRAGAVNFVMTATTARLDQWGAIFSDVSQAKLVEKGVDIPQEVLDKAGTVAAAQASQRVLRGEELDQKTADSPIRGSGNRYKFNLSGLQALFSLLGKEIQGLISIKSAA